MDEPSLETRIATARSQAQELEARLSKRRAAEAAELQVLERERAQVVARGYSARGKLCAAGEWARVYELREARLERRLADAQRPWTRLGEPVVGATSLFVAVACVWLTGTPSTQAALGALVFIIGAAVTRLANEWSRRP